MNLLYATFGSLVGSLIALTWMIPLVGVNHVRPDTYTQRAVFGTGNTCPECGGEITNGAHPCTNGMQCEDCPYIGPGRRG